VYAPVLGADFVRHDDERFIVKNPYLQRPMDRDVLEWIFTADLLRDSPHADFWIPVTFLSRRMDAELFGMNAGGHHATNLLFHLMNTALLFGLLNRLTGRRGRSLAVAALFALHPLQVEAVAWVSSRKDVLSLFWALLTLGAYSGWVRRKNAAAAVSAFVFYVLSVLSKPMMVTLPAVLVLWDLWPLCLWPDGSGFWRAFWRRIPDKLPFLAVSLLICLVTVWGGGPDVWRIKYEFNPARLIVHYGNYLAKLLWPLGLCVRDTQIEMPLGWHRAALSLLAVFLISVFCVRGIKRRPDLFTGWFWFVGTLVPVTGMVWSFERFTYYPMIGFWIFGAGIWERILRRAGRFGKIGPFVFGTVLLVFSVLSHAQAGTWKNDKSLFEHALKVDGKNSLAHNNLGAAAYLEGDEAEALEHFRSALEINPANVKALGNLAIIHSDKGESEKSIRYYRAALRLKPTAYEMHNGLCGELIKAGREEEALDHCREALRISPSYAKAYYHAGLIYLNRNQHALAEAHFRKAIHWEPGYWLAHLLLARTLVETGGYEEAGRLYQGIPEGAVEQGRLDLGLALLHSKLRQWDEAIRYCRKALSAQPGSASTWNKLGVVYAKKGDYDEAEETFLKALRLEPGNRVIGKNLELLRRLKLKKRGDARPDLF